MSHGRSFARGLASIKRRNSIDFDESKQPRSQAEFDLWVRLMDPAQTSIIEFLEAVDLDGAPIFKIATKEVQADGTVQIPLKLWPNQRKIVEEIEDMWASGHAAKLYIPKSREHGTSFIIQAVFAERFLRGGGGDMRTVSHKNEATLGLCEDFDTILSRIPAWVYTTILHGQWVARRSGSWKFVAKGPKKCIAKTMTCRDNAIGRGDRLRWMHLSEPPWWPRGQKAIKGALVTLKDTPGNIYVFESTGRNYDEFYRGCLAAMNGESDWRCVFLSVMTHPEKYLPFASAAQREEFIASIGRRPEYDADDEMRWVSVGQQMGCPNVPERLHWRRVQLAGVFQWDAETLRQEHALTFEDVFRVDSDSAFDTNVLDSRRKASELEWKQWERGDFEVLGTHGDVRVSWVPSRFGKWWLGKQPVRGHTYAYGCDPASGKKVVRNGKREADFATIVIRDVTSHETVCIYQAHTSPEDLSVDLLATCKFYGWARGYPEANNDGKVLLSVNVLPLLSDRWEAPTDVVLCQAKLEYSNGARMWRETPGFWSDSATKHAAVSRTKRWVRTIGQWTPGTPSQIPFPLMCEMRLFQANQKTDQKTGGTTGLISYAAASGHDDLVTAFMLALEAEEWLSSPEHADEVTVFEPTEQDVYDAALMARARRELGMDDPEPSRIWHPRGTHAAGTRDKKDGEIDPSMGVLFA